MEVRAADASHRTAIREVARRSFRTSYSYSPDQIETIVETAFGDDALTARIEGPEAVVLVAVEDGRVVGFADAEAGDEGVLRWLHVDMDVRGQGVGTALMERARAALADRGIEFEVRVLEGASEGATFLERFGLRETGSVTVEYGGETLREAVFEPGVPRAGSDGNEPVVEVPERVAVDGTRPVDQGDPIPGDEAPFFPVYEGESRGERYGFFCSNCGGTDVSADGLDRLACGDCGNAHRADEWDGAYL